MLGAKKIVSDIDTPVINHRNGSLENPIGLLNQRPLTPYRNEKKQHRLISTSINP